MAAGSPHTCNTGIYTSCQLGGLATVAQMHSDATKMTRKRCHAEFAVSQSVLNPVDMLVDKRADKEKGFLLAVSNDSSTSKASDSGCFVT